MAIWLVVPLNIGGILTRRLRHEMRDES